MIGVMTCAMQTLVRHPIVTLYSLLPGSLASNAR